MSTRIFPILLIIVAALGIEPAGGQTRDSRTRTGLTVLIDAAHHNVDEPIDRASFARGLQAEGYLVRELARPFDRAALDGIDIVIVKNALSARNALQTLPPTEEDLASAWRLPNPSAFSPEEIRIIHQWVSEGGALLLVFDHMPMPGGAQELAGTFGIEISNGFAVDGGALRELEAATVARAGAVMFRRVDGTLSEDPITNGSGLEERIDSVSTYTGAAFRLPPGGRSLLTLAPSFVSLQPEVAWQFQELTTRQSVGGWSQGGVLRLRRGRVAVFGDAAVLVTPEMVKANRGRGPRGQNPQFLRNVIDWLSGLPKDPE